MKKTLLTLTLALVSVGALAQGRINVLNDASSLIVMTTVTGLLKANDVSMAGQAVGNTVLLPSGIVLEAGIYGGTSSSSLFLYSTTLLNVAGDPAGYAHPFGVALTSQPNGAPNIPGIALGTPFGAATPWFQLKVWDSTYPTYAAALAANAYVSLSGNALFQMNPQTSAIARTPTTPPGPNSSWAETPIVVGLVPEPSSFALAGLGAAALMIFRRRK